MTGLHQHTERLAVGAAVLARRAGRAFSDCPRRELLYRLAAAVFALWMLGGFVLAERRVLWLLLAAGLAACWHAGRGVERRRAAEAALVQYVRDRIGDRNGVLLADVLAGLQAARMHEGWDVHALRVVIEGLGIPVRDTLNVGGDRSVGVHVDDLTGVWDVQPTPPPAPSGNPSPAPVTRDNYPTTPRAVVSAGGGQTILYSDGEPPAAADEEAERLRLQAHVNRVVAAKEEAFEDHLTDALGLLQEQPADGH